MSSLGLSDSETTTAAAVWLANRTCAAGAFACCKTVPVIVLSVPDLLRLCAH